MPNRFLITFALSLLSRGLFAQEALAQKPAHSGEILLDDIVVSSQRLRLSTAQAIKQSSVEIVDAVVADEVNKLPDYSIAEAMQRITGVQLTRDRGEGSANQANYSANDARLSAGISIRGLPMVETLLNGREVFTAGRGRTLNFADIPADMVSAISVYKTSSAAQMEGGVGGLVDLRTRVPFDFSGRHVVVSTGAIHGNLADKVAPQGALLASNRWAADWGEFGALLNVAYQKRTYREEYQESGTTTVNGVSLPSTWTQTVNVGTRERLGVSTIFQWRPTDQLELYAEAHHSQLKTLENAAQLFVTNTGSASDIALFPGTSDAAQVTWTGASIAEIPAASRDTVDRNTQFALGGQWFGEALTLKADLSHTQSDNRLRYSGVFLSGANATGFSHDVSETPSVASFSTENRTFTTSTPLYAFVPFSGALTALQLDGEYQVSGKWLDSLSAGVRYAMRRADDGSGQLSLTNPSSNLLGMWGIEEASRSVYVMAKIKAQALPIEGNAGVRVVHTKEHHRGFQGASNATAESLHFDQSDVDVLPSVNVRYALDDGLYLRAAASKTVTRPDFNQMSPSLTLNAAPTIPIGSAGNPNLRPIHADNFDIALEKYINKTTSLHVSGFKKNVDGFISSVTNSETHDGIVYQVTRPYNTGASVIRGVEVGYQQFYDFLPSWLGGLGLQVNYTYVDSDVTDSALPLAGVSKNSANLIGMYEKGPISLRLAYSWRDAYLTTVSNGIPVYMDAYGWLDASIGYRFTDQISLKIEGNNLSGTRRQTYFERKSRPQTDYANDTQVSATMTVQF